MSPDTAAPLPSAPASEAPVRLGGIGPGGSELYGSELPGNRVGTPISFTEEQIGEVRFGPDGLVPAVIQDATDGCVLMLGYMNSEALRRTLRTGRSWFWSRSRQEYWCKGETSGDRQWVRAVSYDCDGDAILVVVDQDGQGACHTGERSCFYRSFGADDGSS